jgi:hypothetical protein
VVPEQHAQPGQYFKDTYVEVRDGLRNLARAKNVEPDEVLGFPDASRKVEYAAGEVPLLLAMLQLTEKALSIMLQAPDPVERYLITHTAPIETGPADRPPLLREYPLRLEVTGSLKTILTILHRLGQIDGDDDYPLIVRGLTISSENTKARDDVQQLRAVIEIAGMQFLSDAERGETPAAAAAGSGGSPRAGTARP